MAQRIGPREAAEVGDIHEDYGDNPSDEQEMDRHNNRVGREIGRDECADCDEECKKALRHGRLRVLPLDRQRG